MRPTGRPASRSQPTTTTLFAEGRGSKASGWIQSLFRRGPELLAEIDWTDAARAAIAAGEYRGASAEFARDHVTENGTHRGFAIVGAALTNRPFLRDLTVALSADRRAEAAEHLAEIETLIETGDYNREACRHALATVRLMAEQDLDYADAAAAAYREENPR